ncbi:ABC transporter permease subunit [Dickeya chrysanthemi]|uniref:ABC transporter permease subunit n=1 Tax=Dickeya chrysanthemi TaxID=556 RepID=UPI00039F9926|nr:ABC transporter permease subunit [Dickeya chrysanthemi]MBX9444944.1 ABC transporter permease subunit [Dickeya chrysanthemi]
MSNPQALLPPIAILSSSLLVMASRLLTTLAIIVLVGLLPWLSDADPALSLLRARSSEQEATAEALEAIRQHLGLSQGPWVFLKQWLNGLVQGDVGVSWVSGKPVLPGMLEAAGVSLTLMLAALTVAAVLALLLSWPTLKRGLAGDNRRSNGILATALTAMPEFLLSSFLLIIGAVWLQILPPYGWQSWQHLVLPALALGIPAGGLLGKLFSDALAATFSEPWLLTWHMAGFSRRDCLSGVVRRALPAILPQVGLVLVGLTGGAVAVEKVFAIPGLGRATLGAAAAQDLPPLQCGVLILLVIAVITGSIISLLHRILLGQALDNGSLSTPASAIAVINRHYRLPFMIMLLLAVIVLSGLPRDPFSSDFTRLQPPDGSLPFGADATGRDMLARVAHGALATLLTAAAVTGCCLLLGVFIGLFPRLLSGPAEAANAIPPVIAGMVVAALYGPSTSGAAFAVALVAWAPLAAHTAALVTEINAQPYIRLTPLFGLSRFTCVIRYIIPALIGPVTRHAMLRLPGIALALASLGFLGLGEQPPSPEWGRVLAEGMPYVERAVWTVLPPVFALILLSVLAVSLSQSSRR